MLDGRLQLEVG